MVNIREFNSRETAMDYRVTNHLGFSIWKLKGVSRFQVRWYQGDLRVWHVWSPWADTIEEAKGIVDKLLSGPPEEFRN